MKSPNLLKAVQPFIAVIAVIATAITLVVAIYFTLLDLAWIAFLAGIVFAGLIAIVSRATRAEVAASHRGAELAVAEDKLRELGERAQKLETMLSHANTLLQFADEMMPAMVAYADAEGIYRYHNRAFRRWLDLPAHRIDGHPMREALGRGVFAQIEPALMRAFAGEMVRYERTHKMEDGTSARIHAQLLPLIGAHGKSLGIFAILTQISGPSHVQVIGLDSTATEPESQPAANTSALESLFNASVAEDATGIPHARERIMAAIERNEFSLFCQRIEPLDRSAGLPGHYEILIRLREEEENLIPPGAFFPLAEESGLLPQLDRWVVANLLQWLENRQGSDGNLDQDTFFLNIATATLCDADFPDYVAQQLYKHQVSGRMICFELAASDLAANRGDIDEFVRAVKLAGCKVALSGFGREHASVNVLRDLPLDFLKIDGGVVLNILRDPVSMSKLVAINRIAKAIGITTIAELVEDDATIASLRQVGVAYCQGFGVSRPQPLADLG